MLSLVFQVSGASYEAWFETSFASVLYEAPLTRRTRLFIEGSFLWRIDFDLGKHLPLD